MFSLPLSICRHLVRRRTFRLMCSGLDKKPETSIAHDTDWDMIPVSDFDNTRLAIGFTTKYLNELDNHEDIRWDDLTGKLGEMKVKNPTTKILQACIRLRSPDMGLKYYKYLRGTGKKLTPLDVMFFSRLLLWKKSEIKNHEKLLKMMYEEIKDYVHSSPLIRMFVLPVLVEIPSCFEDIVKQGRNSVMIGGYFPVVQKALELNMPDVAYEFMSDNQFFATQEFINHYINFCINRVKEGNFSVDFINKLVDVCSERALTFTHEDLLTPLESLVDALNEHQDEYHWSISQCKVNDKSVCSNCSSTLLSKEITNDEFEMLKEHFFKQSFIDSSVYLSSTQAELKKFLNFLHKTKPYDIVLDGLNLMYKNKLSGLRKSNRYLKYFLEKKFSVLTIGRVHSKSVLTKGDFVEKYKKKCQFFFTENASDDDLFVIYATLHRGPKTVFVTGDHLNTHLSRLEPELRSIFVKWQTSHQYLVSEDLDLMPPLPHCGLPQLTVSTKNKLVWHLSRQATARMKVHRGTPIEWFCLKAEKEKERT